MKIEGGDTGNFRMCKVFARASWSATPNTTMNCANSVSAGITFEQIIESMYSAGILYPTDKALQPSLTYDHDFALYTHS